MTYQRFTVVCHLRCVLIRTRRPGDLGRRWRVCKAKSSWRQIPGWGRGLSVLSASTSSGPTIVRAKLSPSTALRVSPGHEVAKDSQLGLRNLSASNQSTNGPMPSKLRVRPRKFVTWAFLQFRTLASICMRCPRRS